MSAIFVIFLRYAESFVRFRAGCWHFVWLQYADNCQQSFSSDAQPSLHTALPAIEKLYTKWEQAAAKDRYSKFKDALTAAIEKLEEYYERTVASDAHIIAMGMLVILLLFFAYPAFDSPWPHEKFKHFVKNWPLEQQKKVDVMVKKVVCDFHLASFEQQDLTLL